MIHTATQSTIKNYGKAPAVRVKHFFSCCYKGLVFLAKTLRGVKTETKLILLNWPRKLRVLANVAWSICEWGHARLAFEEDVNDFDDQDHMMVENFLFQSMKPVYLVTTPSSWLPQLTLMRTTRFLLI